MIVRLLHDHLGGHILECTTESCSLRIEVSLTLGNCSFNAPAKIANFENVVSTYEEIFWLQISMDEAIFMQEIKSGDSLDPEVEGFIFSKLRLVITYNMEQIAAQCVINVLKDQIDVLFILETCVEAHNMLVLQLLLDFNLSSESLLQFWRLNTSFVHFLYCNFRLCRDVRSDLH